MGVVSQPVPPGAAVARRPSGWWFALGAVLVLAGLVTAGVLLVGTLRGFLTTDVSVPVDGRAHRVEVATDGDRLLWVDEAAAAPTCRVVDTATGEKVELRGPGAELRRRHGSGDDQIGARRFAPGSGRLEVTCTGAASRSSALVEIGPAPDLPAFAGSILAAILVPLLLGGAGLSVLLVTGILFATRPARLAHAGPDAGGMAR